MKFDKLSLADDNWYDYRYAAMRSVVRNAGNLQGDKIACCVSDPPWVDSDITRKYIDTMFESAVQMKI